MKTLWRTTLLCLGTGLAVAAGALAQAHIAASPHAGADPAALLSAAGTSAELADRSRQMAAHVCEVIGKNDDCPLAPLADAAASDLLALGPRERAGQVALHHALLDASIDDAAWREVEQEQLALVETASRRYLLFLAEAATVLDAAQMRRFEH